MDYTHLGRTGLKVSRLCLGTMNFGPQTSEKESFEIMDKALDLGFNFFDTANVYGWKIGEGITENIIGRWLAQGNGRREKIVLATKVYGKMGEGPNDSRLSAYHIRRACEESLRRMQTDHIDLYQMHHVDRSTPWDEIWQAMEQLIREGKILYVGSSNFAAWNLVQANAIASQHNLMGIVSEQSKYNLTCRSIELEVIPACQALGIGIIPWAPLAGGLLGGILDGPTQGRRATSKDVQAFLEENHTKVETYENLCSQLGETPDTVALAWLLRNPAITAPIIGPRTMDQFTRCLRALEISLSQDTLTSLDEIWSGPGGQAPEAYAW